jgi:hypothetical protein
MFSEYINKQLVKCQKYIDLYNNKSVNTSIVKPDCRIVAIGDIHGDIDLMLKTLLIGKVIKKTDKSNNSIKLNNKGNKEYYQWIGGKTIVVQVGDQIDRCRPTLFSDCKSKDTTYKDEASDIEILLFFTNLNELAKIYGGAVYSLLGNHELMNSFGDIRYVSYENLKQVQISNNNFEEGRIRIFRRGDILSNFLACTRSSILIVNGYLFVHGGVLGSFIINLNNNNKYNQKHNNYAVFEIINNVIKQWLMNNDHDLNVILNNNYGTTSLPTHKTGSRVSKRDNTNYIYRKIFKNNNIYKFIIDIDSPFYTRKLGNIKPKIGIDDPSCREVHNLIQHFELNGIIIGHTPQIPYGINGTCGDKLYRIDIASSKAFFYALKGDILEPQVLEISNNETKVIQGIYLH